MDQIGCGQRYPRTALNGEHRPVLAFQLLQIGPYVLDLPDLDLTRHPVAGRLTVCGRE
jgi:hypothetical protein